MKKNIIAMYFLMAASSVSAMNALPFGGSINRCRNFIIYVVGEKSPLNPITFERVRKWRTYFRIIANGKNKKEDEIFLRLRLSDSSAEEVSNTLDEVLLLSALIKDYSRLIGKKRHNSDDLANCVELLAFLTS
ncbi:MAG: hypothetical protein LBJ96_03790 [Holosporaceae bacterium]|nr:hypothetical protein [Holosporaceae bacterium]